MHINGRLTATDEVKDRRALEESGELGGRCTSRRRTARRLTCCTKGSTRMAPLDGIWHATKLRP